MQCGPVRHRVDAKSEAIARPFEHSVIVRPTSFRPISEANDDQRIQFQDLYRELIHDQDRNRMICEDVVRSIRDGRSPFVLTERRNHLDELATKLEKHIRHVVVLKGGAGIRESRAIMERLTAIKPEEDRVLLATGRYIGEGFDNPKNEKAIKGMEETYKRFNQWRKGVDAVVKTPENQAIIAEIARTEPNILHPLRFYRYAHRLKGTPDARDFGFPEAHAPATANPDWPSTYPYLKHYASLPHRDTGAYLKPTKGTRRVIVSPENFPLGNYTLRVRVGAVEGSDPSRHFIDVGHPQRTYTAVEFDYGLEGRAISTHQVSGTIEEPQIIEVPLEVRSDTIREFAVQEKQPNNGNMKALVGTFSAAMKKNGYGIPPAI